MTLQDFKKEKIVAMKEKNADKVAALNNVISKLMLVEIEQRAAGKELSDADVVKVLQKVDKELNEEREGFIKANRQEKVDELTRYIAIISDYLPKMMSADEIKAVIMTLDDKSVPSVMKHFKTNYAGKCDMKTVNEVLRTL